MIKRALIAATAAVFIFCGMATQGFSDDPVPAEMTLESTGSKKPKPAIFPHKAHQDAIGCADCHHGMKDGKQVPYVEGMEIGKCESCHNSEVLAGKKLGKLKMDTFKGAGHGNCLACHKEEAKKDAAKKALKKCSTCHPKKK